MGSFFGNIGSAIKKGVVDTGHFIGKAQSNPIVKGLEAAGLAATGVGIPASAAILAGAGAAGGALRPGGGLKGALTQGAQGALTGAAAGAVGDVVGQGGIGLGGLKSGAGKLGSLALSKLKGGTSAQPEYDSNGEPITSDPNYDAGGGFSLGNFLKGNAGNLITGGLGAASAINSSQLQGKANDFANKAVDTSQQSFDARAPLRVAGIAGMLKPVPSTDVSGLSKRAGQGNPFARSIPLSSVG